MILCKECGELMEKSDFNTEMKECNDCHTANDYELDECACENCVNQAVGQADYLLQD